MSETLEVLALFAHQAKVAMEQATENWVKAEHEFVTQLQFEEAPSVVFVRDGRELKATLVQSERTRVDGEGLEEALEPEVYDLITKRSIDASKLKVALTAGEIDPEVIDQYTETYFAKPYIRFTWGDAVERDDQT
jgi:hypothetical protein